MATYAILAQEPHAGIGDAIKAKFESKYYEIGPGQWIVVEPGKTNVKILEQLGAAEGEFGSVVILTVSNYWGHHDKNLWEWLSKMESKGDG